MDKMIAKVKAAMDKMIAELKEEQKEEVDLKLFCEKEFDDNQKMTYTNTEKKSDLEGEIESLAALIKKLTGEIEAAEARIVGPRGRDRVARRPHQEAHWGDR